MPMTSPFRPRRLRRACPSILALALLSLMGLAVSSAAEAPHPLAASDEVLHYRWHLGSFLGALASLFFPSEGDGELSFRRDASGDLVTELQITSEKSREGEYFRYGAEIDADKGTTVRAWSSYRWRGKVREKRADIEGEKVVDVASGIYAIRRDPPEKPRPMEIWSDDETYPVIVIPLGQETWTASGGRSVETRHFSVRGVRMHDRPYWKERLDLWLTTDGAAVPVQIVLQRSLATVSLELTDLSR